MLEIANESGAKPAFFDALIWFFFLGNLALSLLFWFKKIPYQFRVLRFVMGLGCAIFGMVMGGLLFASLSDFTSFFWSCIYFSFFFFFGFQDVVRAFFKAGAQA